MLRLRRQATSRIIRFRLVCSGRAFQVYLLSALAAHSHFKAAARVVIAPFSFQHGTTPVFAVAGDSPLQAAGLGLLKYFQCTISDKDIPCAGAQTLLQLPQVSEHSKVTSPYMLLDLAGMGTALFLHSLRAVNNLSFHCCTVPDK